MGKGGQLHSHVPGNVFSGSFQTRHMQLITATVMSRCGTLMLSRIVSAVDRVDGRCSGFWRGQSSQERSVSEACRSSAPCPEPATQGGQQPGSRDGRAGSHSEPGCRTSGRPPSALQVLWGTERNMNSSEFDFQSWTSLAGLMSDCACLGIKAE